MKIRVKCIQDQRKIKRKNKVMDHKGGNETRAEVEVEVEMSANL